MLTGELRSKIDTVWNAFWAGGIANPLEVIEQITYLLFMRGLDEAQTREENRANRTRKPMERRIFPEGKDGLGQDGGVAYEDMRWSRLKNRDPGTMFNIVSEHVFPFLRTMADAGTAHATHMKGARFTIPTPALLAKVVDLLADIPMEDRDTKGDLYEYMLSKIATAGQNGQFRTPRHIIALMVEMMAPGPKDVIVDPACGTCGFLVAAGEYLRDNHPKLFHDKESRDHFHEEMFHGFDFDGTMLRIGSMNMALHGVDDPDIRYKDSLAQEHAGDSDRYSLVLANPPFAGSLDYETTAKDLLAVVKTKKTELLFMALFLKLLKPGGRAAVIVPDGVLFGSSTAHRAIRKMLVEDHKLDGIIKLPSGVFRPYAGVSTAIVLFTKTNLGGTDLVWFYDCQADGFSLDDKRNPLLSADKIGPEAALGDDEHAKNNLPDIVVRWFARAGAEIERTRSEQSFCVPKAEIASASYDLSINRYKQLAYEVVEHRIPKKIVAELKALEKEIAKRLRVTDVELLRFRLSVGDVVINRVNSLEYLGKSALVRRLVEPTVYESNMMRFSIDNSVMLPEACIALLQTREIRQQILSRAKNAVNQSSINQSDVCALSLPMPTMVNQKKYAEALEESKKLQANVANACGQTRELFLVLQHRAFSGQLRGA